MAKPTIPQGTRDFGAEVVRKRTFILNTIKSAFEVYGFQPLETPAMENLDTLMGKYGDEGDKLIFKILNNGLDNPAKEQSVREDFEKILEGKNTKVITERALKYDLTIPFARYVAMNYGQLTFPFKRYQIQPVWRADRPQKGRYREFFQCDADVVGSKSLINEVEFVNIYNDVFRQLKIKNYQLKINSRKILTALAELTGGLERMMDITIVIDKLDKIGIERVKEELSEKGLNKSHVQRIEEYLNITGNNEEKLNAIKTLFGDSEVGQEGIKELEYVMLMVNSQWSESGDNTEFSNHNSPLTLDFTLARGLNYYTGIIFEAKAPEHVKIGSIGGGGRYDDLTGLFGVPNIPGVGISFGVDRIYDVMEELNLFPESVETGTQILFFNLGEEECKTAYKLLQQTRSSGIVAEIYPEQVKLDKQFKYAEKKKIKYAVIVGSKEMEEKVATVKDIVSGEQRKIPFDQIKSII